jgi:DNA-directed RNA polymerase subunit A'
MEAISKHVKAISFSLFSPEQIKKQAVAKIVTPELYDMDGYPIDGGLMDLRLGAIDPGVRCRTCGGKLKECLGHFGYIELARPIMHLKYIPFVELCLRCFCYECGRILVDAEGLEKLKVAGNGKLNVTSLIKKAKDTKKCPYCNAVHDKIKIEKPTSFYFGKKRSFPTTIRAGLAKIPDDDLRLIGVNPLAARPEWSILTLVFVPPVTVRPSITLETGERSEDDLTHKLGDIIRANQRLWENLNAGAPEVIIEDLWDLLQYHVTTFFDNTITNVPPARHRSGQPLKTIAERIKGKEGRIRHNLAGKRVNFSSRSVISPEPCMEINEVGIPYEIAKILTVPERVTTQNIERLKTIVAKGDNYPGAAYIIRPDGKKKRITDDLKEELLEELDKGYIVERHLYDGDIVLFNRHPSLHRASLMAHYAKILPSRTFRLHPAVTFPYNADFDGDEMNVHVPQTEEARAEAKILLDVNEQLMSPKNNTNVIGCISDALNGNYLLTKTVLQKKDAVQLLALAGMNFDEIVKKTKAWGKSVDGKKVFSALLPEIDIEIKTKERTVLRIKDGDIVSGVIDSNAIGVESGELIKELDRIVGRKKAVEILRKIFTLGTAYLSRRGFSLSLDDINVKENIKNLTKEITSDSERKVKDVIDSYYSNTIEILPGKTKEETREIKILQVLNSIRSKIGEIIKEEMPEENPASIMIKSGAGGSILSITQMACSVGQQVLWAKRIGIGYTGRTLSHFKKNDFSPRAHGFIYSSFFDGLKPDEFFFSVITGRDSLMDTALRTPKSGYLYRRLVNALQDLRVEYDGTVRDSSSSLVQFIYGEDGVDVSKAHLKNNKIASGEAIGTITAQSFGEPSTQMTLNVFHFAGVQEMAITVGLPRLIEILDARKKPSTPAMEIFIDSEHNNEEDAKTIAEKIKQVRLSDIAESINIHFTDAKIEIKLDRNALKEAHITAPTVVKVLVEKGFKAKVNDDSISIKAEDMQFKEIYRAKEKIKSLIIAGVLGIEQVLLIRRENQYVVLTAGSNLAEILKIKGVDANKTITNDLYEIANVLGIEAAREAIIFEINKVISKQGLDIDRRHILLIADAMTAAGEVKGTTRIGIISNKSSVLARASFETPIKQFINASLVGQQDKLSSVIENVILNQPIPVGTGLPGLMVKITGSLAEKEDEKKAKEKPRPGK